MSVYIQVLIVAIKVYLLNEKSDNEDREWRIREIETAQQHLEEEKKKPKYWSFCSYSKKLGKW